jgi:hypothetical protein
VLPSATSLVVRRTAVSTRRSAGLQARYHERNAMIGPMSATPSLHAATTCNSTFASTLILTIREWKLPFPNATWGSSSNIKITSSQRKTGSMLISCRQSAYTALTVHENTTIEPTSGAWTAARTLAWRRSPNSSAKSFWIHSLLPARAPSDNAHSHQGSSPAATHYWCARDGSRMARDPQSRLRDLKGLGLRQPGPSKPDAPIKFLRTSRTR